MSCDHRAEAERLLRLLESGGFGRARVEPYGSYHLVVLEVCEGFYTFVSVSCSNGGYYYEFALGDENFVFGVEGVECLDKAVSAVKRVAEAVPRQTDRPPSS